MVKFSSLCVFLLLLLASCFRSQSVPVDRQEKCKQWKMSLTYQDTVSCELKNLNMGGRLDSLLSCVFEKNQNKIFCSEANNEFTFSLTDELCEKEGQVCIRTSRYMPNDNCEIIDMIISGGNLLNIKKKNESFDIETLCGDFGCNDYFMLRVDFCIKKFGF